MYCTIMFNFLFQESTCFEESKMNFSIFINLSVLNVNMQYDNFFT